MVWTMTRRWPCPSSSPASSSASGDASQRRGEARSLWKARRSHLTHGERCEGSGRGSWSGSCRTRRHHVSCSSSLSPTPSSNGLGGVEKRKFQEKAKFQLCRTDGFTCETESQHVAEGSFVKFDGPATQNHMLVWKSCPKTVLVLKKRGTALLPKLTEVARHLWYEQNLQVVVEPEVAGELESLHPDLDFFETFDERDVAKLHEFVDFIVCLGGDGVVLHASNLFPKAMPPVISFHLGSLGFLTNHKHEDHQLDLSNMCNSCYPTPLSGVFVTLRMRLSVQVLRKGVPVPGKKFEVLNEVCVDRGSNSYLCMIECYERNRLITKVQGDGVLLSTPTGSTAYSVSAGGSIVHPSVPAILFTPVCPHSLSFRPVLLPDSAELELKVPERARSTAWVSFDGKNKEELLQGDSITVRMSDYPMPSINKTDETDDWFKSLVRCLRWNERLEQTPFGDEEEEGSTYTLP
ncbi:ATP-NAD kinase [Chloropicon primus]|uniref:ATP-NAD kinase n=1 Tax=Chloropicon primus TaxID=1764295 RepID=A0A5B8MUJ2_9CHLO|nr:ATP-NAD kinase [Chloropicon primus]UPR02636.1 ATP-NAD kinase [Chloropicon primus]|mmetsp:Transcript_14135/g.40038  ORF Transcript_14135/g.40038 Transcript_14135/m.40038 type:complete len:463 (+) Transcript_14135:71-1459(+)|eukprot:QDZ23424.1 ATP-NAD kinase [Chloropicon primus]